MRTLEIKSDIAENSEQLKDEFINFMDIQDVVIDSACAIVTYKTVINVKVCLYVSPGMSIEQLGAGILARGSSDSFL